MGDSSLLPPKVSSPGLHPQNKPNLPSHAQTGIQSPWFMQRPQGSGIDTTAFSFAKPAIHRQSFTLSKPPRLPTVNSIPLGHSLPLELPKPPLGQPNHRDELQRTRILSHVEPRPQHTEGQIPNSDFSDLGNADSFLPVILCRKKSSPVGTEVTSPRPKPRAETTQQQTPVTNNASKVAAAANHKNPEKGRVVPDSTSSGSSHNQVEKADAVTPLDPAFHEKELQKNDFLITKVPGQTRKTMPTRRQRSISFSKVEPHQLNEDNLFELLIRKMKQREEKEAAVAAMNCQMETENTSLKDENQGLRQQLHVSQLRLQKSTEESKASRCLLSEWKSKIRNFKQVVNELGHGYDALHDEANRHRETVLALAKEKDDLTRAIDQTKIRISQAEGMIVTQQNQISESEKTIASLEHALSASRVAEESANSQLSEQKRRTVTLESYIQNYALAHKRQLDLMKKDQESLTVKFATGLMTVTRDSASSREAVLLAIKDAYEDCRSSILSMSERFSEEQENVAEFTVQAHDVVSRIDSLSSRFSENIEGGIKINNGVAKTLQKKFQEIECHLSPDSPMFKLLCQNDTSYVALKGKFKTLEPTLNALGTSARALTTKEDTLIQELATFSKNLVDTQAPRNNPVLELELANKVSENTRLQIQLHDLSSKVVALQKSLDDKETLIQDTQRCLVDVNAKQETADRQRKQLEAEKGTLQQEFAATEKRIRLELGKQNAELIEQMRTEHQAEINGFQKEKEDIEEVSGKLINQLRGIQSSLIDAKRLLDEQGREHKALQLQETEQQIENLEKFDVESKAQLEIQRTEIEKFQELDATSRAENSDLRDQLEQAQQRIHDLEAQPCFPIKPEDIKAPQPTHIVPFATIESQLLGQQTASQYGESYDFTMLFMSDDQCPTPINKGTTQDPPQDQPENLDIDSGPQPGPSSKDPSLISSDKLILSPNKKRKGVNFEPGNATKKGKESLNVQPAASQSQKEVEENPNKASKHTHKWTYSRIQSPTMEKQHEQTGVPAHAATADRRSSPKSLVSASSAPAVTQPKARTTRGRRKGRGQQYDARFQEV
ncbi:hypothetical protein N7520_006640 [Penicillium odoratum]|uniref:uncharacterized protein n=1 Tax=Penicillium odoratum TaxID=1167516 RepID=UPI002546C668|nr:uncharacterized protein N7520_006640 [Penicillium odoratum]KAJ5759484.1 hypothetical protein N7520_006640 [Penicillium odoratum]